MRKTANGFRLALMLLPSGAVIGLLFGGAILYGLAQSFGWQPIIGKTEVSLAAYADILFGAEYARLFWSGLAFSLWTAAASTAISAALAVIAALLLRRTGTGKKAAMFLLQFSLPIPHLVAALGALFLFSQSGLAARVGAALGVIDSPADFPVIVRDGWGLGIILAYIWKETPFIALILLAVLRSLGEDYEEGARTLGANRFQRFRYITLPLLMPALVSSSTIVFAFAFGSYEIPGVLGVRYPQALPVLAYRFFISPDLRDRSVGMALSAIMAAAVLLLTALYMALERRSDRGAKEGSGEERRDEAA